MDGIVVLCHFCEQHGPAVIMCTQPIKQSILQSSTTRKVSSVPSIATSSCGNFQVVPSEAAWSGETSSKLHANLSELITSCVSAQSSGAIQDFNVSNQQTGVCRACSFVTADEMGFTSQDITAKTVYVSTQFPCDAVFAASVRSACMRSLSCEVLPGSEGPVYFGDDANGHVISYSFFVKDAFARGFQVKFSFLLITWNQIFLLNLWPFIVKSFQYMASRLQMAGSRVFEEDEAQTTSRATSPPISCFYASPRGSVSTTPPNYMMAASPPHQMISTPSGYQNPPLLSSQAIAAGNAVLASQHFLTSSGISASGGKKPRQRRAMELDMRSLSDLTKDDKIFYRIHAWFTWLLRLSAREWTVYPTRKGPVNEDLLFETEEHEDQLGEQIRHGNDSLCLASSVSGTTPVSPVIYTSRIAIGQSLGWSDGSTEVETELQMRFLRRLFVSVGEDAFSNIVNHVIIGNQVIVLPLEDSRLGSLTVTALSRFLPRGCIHMVLESAEYIPAYVCNLLSLMPEAFIPNGFEIDEQKCFLIKVSIYSPTMVQSLIESKFNNDPNFSLESSHSVADSIINSLHFMPTSVVRNSKNQQSNAADQIAEPMKNTSFLHPSSPWSTNPQQSPPATVTTSRLVKQIIELFRLDPPLPPSTLDQLIAAARQEWIDRTRLLYSFQKCQDPNDDLARKYAGVASVLQCSEPEDEAVIRFWQKCLSQQTRNSVCHNRRTMPSWRNASACGNNASLLDMNSATCTTE